MRQIVRLIVVSCFLGFLATPSLAQVQGVEVSVDEVRVARVAQVMSMLGVDKDVAKLIVAIHEKKVETDKAKDQELGLILDELMLGVMLTADGKKRAEAIRAKMPLGQPGTRVSLEDEREIRLVGEIGLEASHLLSGASTKLILLSVRRFLDGRCGQRGFTSTGCMTELDGVLVIMRSGLDMLKASSDLLFTSARIGVARGFVN